MEAISRLLKSKSDKVNREFPNGFSSNFKPSFFGSESAKQEQDITVNPKFEASFSISNILNLAGKCEEIKACENEIQEDCNDVERRDGKAGTYPFCFLFFFSTESRILLEHCTSHSSASFALRDIEYCIFK